MTLLCGACGHAPPAPAQEEIVQRGVLIARGWSVAELTKGPALVHVYSQSVGGTVYLTATTPAGTGDCTVQAPATALAEASLEPDKRLTVAVRDGEVVCLRTPARRTIEILWHAHKVPSRSPQYELRVRPAAMAASKL